MQRRFHYGIVLILLPVVTFLAGVNLGAARPGIAPTAGGSLRTRLELDNRLLQTVLEEIRNVYYRPEDVSTDLLSQGAAIGMVDALGDPHSTYFPPEEAAAFQESIQGSLEGIGAELQRTDGRIVVTAVLRDTPAQRAGLGSGDAILKIDGEETAEMSLGDAVRRIRGPRGTSVRLSVLAKDKDEIRELTVVREQLSVPSVQWEMRGKTAVATLSFFRDGTADELARAAQEALTKGATAFVLDLRDNPGGVLEEAVKVTGLFVEEGAVVIQRGREQEKTYAIADGQYVIRVEGKQGAETLGAARPFLKDVPLVVLVNESSASASEIVAGALQDHGRAKLIGSKTYGKGSVQELLPVSAGGNEGSVKLTVAEWFTPKGRSIEEVGLAPDQEVARSDEDIAAGRDPQLEAALNAEGR